MSGPNLRDALLKITRALPNGAANVTSTSIDLGLSNRSDFLALCELLLTVPDLATGVMGDTKTMVYDVLMSDNSDLSAPTVLFPGILTQTGAGGVGAAGTSLRFRLPSNVKRYIGIKITGSATGNASTSNATLELLF